jgi:hypothetical protein
MPDSFHPIVRLDILSRSIPVNANRETFKDWMSAGF